MSLGVGVGVGEVSVRRGVEEIGRDKGRKSVGIGCWNE